MANWELGENIAAATRLGDMAYLGTDLNWIAGLLEHRGMPSLLLDGYLQAYEEALQAELDDRGDVIVAWLQRQLEDSAP
jgi:hypothetical protein